MTLKDALLALITRLVEQQNAGAAGGTRWRPPLLAVAAADDPLFLQLRRVVRPSHALPSDLLSGARSVIVFFLPFTPRLGAGNRLGRNSSPGWARAYLQTNALIPTICARLAGHLEALGERACPMPATHNFDPDELVSDWSHRHVAYVAGLGTFGLNNMLITRRGCCGRLGSLVTTAVMAPDPRPAVEACLHRRGEGCASCLDRCVNEALFADAFDRRRCYEMCLENARAHADAEQGIADVCGKCVVKLPCSHTWPRRRAREPGTRPPRL